MRTFVIEASWAGNLSGRFHRVYRLSLSDRSDPNRFRWQQDFRDHEHARWAAARRADGRSMRGETVEVIDRVFGTIHVFLPPAPAG